MGETTKTQKKPDGYTLQGIGTAFGKNPKFCGPPWASRNGTTKGFSDSDPLADFLVKVEKGRANGTETERRGPNKMSDAFADFAACTFALVTGERKAAVVPAQ